MSNVAPWLALAADWQDSEMFEPLDEHGVSEPATMGERLAWVLLLCHAKIKGRGGKVSLRKNAFARDYKLSERSVAGMVSRAQKCKAIEVDGDVVSICNWRLYQDKAFKARAKDCPESGKKRKAAAPLGVMGDGSDGPGGDARGDPKFPPAFDKFWLAWPDHSRKRDRGKCRNLWQTHGLDAEHEVIAAGLQRWRISAEWCKQDGRFIPLVETWLRNRRWEANPEPAPEGEQPAYLPKRLSLAEGQALLREVGATP